MATCSSLINHNAYLNKIFIIPVMETTIRYRNNKYFYDTESGPKELMRNNLMSLLIPGDVIKVDTTGKAVEIILRENITTIAIVRGFYKGKVYLFCPLLGSIYNPSIVLSSANIGDRLLVEISLKSDPIVLKEYGNIHDRTKDFEIIKDIYLTNTVVPSIGLINKHKTYYTKEHQDLRDLPTFTIDPTESKDFDDAISVVDSTVYIHIVDIHSQLVAGSKEDEEASRLAFTLYLAEGNHNILPVELSEDKLSLIAGVEKEVITVEVKFTESLQVEKYDIYPSTIVVKNRYNYDTAPDNPFLASLASATKRHHFTIPQLKLQIDSGKLVDSFHVYNTDINHRIIEMLMVLGNIIVSEHLRKNAVPGFLHIPQRFHSQLKALPEEPLVSDEVVNSFLAIKSFALASYEADKSGHFGLGVSSYTHFTSPIRRYFDVIIHRMLAGYDYEEESLKNLLNHLNKRERLVESLQNLYKAWKIYDIISAGDEWPITVTRVCNAGIYYLYKKYMIDGFIHVSRLGKDIQWTYSDDKLVGNGNEIKIGKQLTGTVEKKDSMTCTLVLDISF
jgi:exoribonuclease R